jgi:hypothetical protein
MGIYWEAPYVCRFAGFQSARQAVPTPMPSRCDMTCHEMPAARSVATGC